MTIATPVQNRKPDFVAHSQVFRQAVEEMAARARQVVPEANGRIEKAVQLVLAGDVELLPDGGARVASQSNGTTRYYVVNGECQCRDFAKAPKGLCKHRLAYGILKRTMALAQERCQARHQLPQQGGPQPEPPTAAQAMALPEAPASVNVRLTLHGREVQVTLRDSDEQRLLKRLAALLQQIDASEPSWCPLHQVAMVQHHNARGSWWSHRLPDGSWCRGT